MSSIFKYPNGNDVEVVRQSDIFELLKDKVTDIELVMAVVQQCESDVEKCLRNGVWTGIPYMGNIRRPKISELNDTEERKEIIEDARRTMDVKAYNKFRHELNLSDSIKIREDRKFNSEATVSANNNLKRYRWLCKNFTIPFAKIKIWAEDRANVIEAEEEE